MLVTCSAWVKIKANTLNVGLYTSNGKQKWSVICYSLSIHFKDYVFLLNQNSLWADISHPSEFILDYDILVSSHPQARRPGKSRKSETQGNNDKSGSGAGMKRPSVVSFIAFYVSITKGFIIVEFAQESKLNRKPYSLWLKDCFVPWCNEKH